MFLSQGERNGCLRNTYLSTRDPGYRCYPNEIPNLSTPCRGEYDREKSRSFAGIVLINYRTLFFLPKQFQSSRSVLFLSFPVPVSVTFFSMLLNYILGQKSSCPRSSLYCHENCEDMSDSSLLISEKYLFSC